MKQCIHEWEHRINTGLESVIMGDDNVCEGLYLKGNMVSVR